MEKKIKKSQSVTKEKKEYSYLSNNNWYAYMHGDKGQPNIDNLKMLRKLSKKYTYARWAGQGKLFGITMGSFVALSKILPHEEDEGRPDICTKMKNVYCQMAVLCLAQRISLLRFSAEIANLAEVTRTEENKRLVGNIKVLYRNYIEFVNKVYYLEITPIISGIELYKQFHKVMEIEENLHEIESEIDNLFNYARLTEAEVQSDEAYKLNKVASLFLPASFLASLLGISFDEISKIFTWHPAFDWLFIIGIGCLISYIILKFIKKREV